MIKNKHLDLNTELVMEDLTNENHVEQYRPMHRDSSSHNQGDASDLGTSTENIQYKEKVESLSSCVKKLHQELQSERLRVEGLNTVSVCLEEERQENEQLRKELQQKDSQIENYKSRLYNLGQSTSLSMGEEDFIVPGQSKVVVENLMKENARLKQNLKYSSGEAVLVEEVQVVNFSVFDFCVCVCSFRLVLGARFKLTGSTARFRQTAY